VKGPRNDEVNMIGSVTAALSFLHSFWPGNTGDKKASADERCRKVLADDAALEDARKAFRDAALQADILD
jgi:hypothetical protein